MTYNNFQEAYYAMLNKVLQEGNNVVVRGLEMKEIIPAYFEILNPRDRLLNIDCRSNITRYIFGELLWYLNGRDDVEFISKYSKRWASLSDDGIHNNSAYGKYIFREMPIKGVGVKYDTDLDEYKSQWDYIKEVLQKDPYSRQAVIHIKPIQMYNTKDVTCTFILQFFIRNNKLDLVVNMRSNDLMFGTTYDVFMFTFLQELMAAELGIDVGVYKHVANNMHIYMKDMPKINEILSENSNKHTMKFFNIPFNFREHDLPILNKVEEIYWKNDKQLTSDCDRYIDSLSKLGKQLIYLLTKDEKYNI